jgi:hypothetical protein
MQAAVGMRVTEVVAVEQAALGANLSLHHLEPSYQLFTARAALASS